MTNKKTKSHLILILITAICIIGAYLRIYFYIINRSLWLDEAMLALNLVDRSFLGLFKQLDLNQGAPIGFLLLQKGVIYLLGNKDYILRLIPLIAGLISIPLMYLLSKQYVGKVSALLSLGLFALSPALIYYSSEAKQYSTDVLVTLALLFVGLKCLDERVTSRSLVSLGIVGSLGIWISHPSLFVFAGILLTLGLTFAVRRDYHHLFWLIGIGSVSVISFIGIYLLNLRQLVSNNFLLDYWSGSFAPLPPWSNFNWYYKTLVRMLINPAGLPVSIITMGLFILGIYSFAIRRFNFVLVLLTPFIFTLVASALHKYPFSDRMILFLVPLLFLLLTEGIEWTRRLYLKVNRFISGIFFSIIIVFLFLGPIIVTYRNILSPPLREHIKPVMSFMHENYQETDFIYVYHWAGPAFEYYAPWYELDHSDYMVGISSREDPTKYLEEIDKIQGYNRVWFIFSHYYPIKEKDFILNYINETKTKLKEYIAPGASIYLYDFVLN